MILIAPGQRSSFNQGSQTTLGTLISFKLSSFSLREDGLYGNEALPYMEGGDFPTRGVLSVDQTFAHCQDGRFYTRGNAQFAIDGNQMLFDRLIADAQLKPRFLVGFSGHNFA